MFLIYLVEFYQSYELQCLSQWKVIVFTNTPLTTIQSYSLLLSGVMVLQQAG